MNKVLLAVGALTCLVSSAPTLAQDDSSSVEDCVKLITSTAEYKKAICTEVSARAPSPGVKGGKRERSSQGCITTLTDSPFLSPPTLRKLSCFGNRCRFDGPIVSNDEKAKTQSFCVTVYAWSESKSFGAGGSANYELCADAKRKPTQKEVIEVLKDCRGTQ